MSRNKLNSNDTKERSTSYKKAEALTKQLLENST